MNDIVKSDKGLFILEQRQSGDIAADVRELLSKSRQLSCRAVNSIMVRTYWLIGERIVIEEQEGRDRATYGEKILKKLSKALCSEFGNGFSYANLRNMRQFYLTYPNWEICYTLCSKLSWSHNRLIMRVQDKNAREFYLREALSQQWSVRQTEREINLFSYQRYLSKGDLTGEAPKNAENDINVRAFVKDPYVLEFVGLPVVAEGKEKNLEQALIEHMKDFLLELGKGFSFVKSQYRISTETSHYYIDLVFYNYILKCFVLIDLKSGKLNHKDVGQMDMYIRMFDDLKRDSTDNPTIGILMCAERDETVVKYSVLNESEQMFASNTFRIFPRKRN